MPLKTSSKSSVRVFEQMTVSSAHIVERSADDNILQSLVLRVQVNFYACMYNVFGL